MTSRLLRVGTGAEPLEQPLSDRCELDLLGAPAAKRLIADDGALSLPWDLLLLLQECFEDDGDRETALRAKLPPWITADDAEILLAAVMDADLPQPTPLKLKVSAKGVAGRPGFDIQLAWASPTGRPLRQQPSAKGGLLSFEDGPPRRMTVGQYELLELLATKEPLGANRQDDLLFQSKVQGTVLEDDRGVAFDAFLSRERVRQVNKVKPRLKETATGYQVVPGLDDADDDTLEDYYFTTPKAQLGRDTLVERNEDGGRQRTVFTDDAREGFLACRTVNELSREDAAHALSHPEEVFGDALDLSDFSERVIGLGPAIHRVVPIVRELSSENWWEWDVEGQLEAVGEGTEEEAGESQPKLDLRDPEVRSVLEDAVRAADERGDAFVPNPFGKGMIEVNDDLRRALAATEPVEDAPSAAPAKEVLQVKENLESLVFDRSALPVPERPPAFEPPPGLAAGASLLPHQEEGYQWLQALYGTGSRRGWKGSLLADDMGLGKTLQVLSLLSWAHRDGRQGPHLVVAPVGLLENWQEEARAFFGATLEPIFQVRGCELPSDSAVAAARLAAQNLVLVSYETLRRQELVFARVHWDAVVLDEAQKAKNPGSQIARVVRTLSARFRLAMSGTPVENNLKELWTIYDWAVPGLLRSLRDFADDFIKPVKTAGHAERVTLSTQLQDLIEPVFVRRMKQEVLAADLPPIEHYRHEMPLSPAQERAYVQALEAQRQDSGKTLGTLINLFGICAHPEMGEGAQLSPFAEGAFPKADRLFELLDQVNELGEKALVFANRRILQRWLANEIGQRYGITVRIINGQVNESRARMSIIKEFSERSGFGALVLAPRAAGVGLNITAANHVIHYTREWNPAVESQATDRAFRIGQRRPVHVHTLVTTSERGETVDEKLARLLDEKRRLMKDFVVPMGGFDVSANEMLAG